MGYTSGYIQYFKNSTTVGGGLSTSGLVSGGTRTEESDLQEIRSVGDYTPQQLREAMIKAHGNVNLLVQSVGMLSLAQRITTPGATYGRLNPFDIECGDYGASVLHSNCKVDSLVLDMAANAELKANLAWKGLLFAAGSPNQVHAPSTDPVLMWYECLISGGTLTGAEVRSASININHNCDWIPLIDNTLTPKRSAKYVVEKAQDIKLNLKMLAPEGTDISADAISYITSVTFVYTGTNTVTITLNNLKPSLHEMPLSPVELIEDGVNFTTKNWSIA